MSIKGFLSNIIKHKNKMENEETPVVPAEGTPVETPVEAPVEAPAIDPEA